MKRYLLNVIFTLSFLILSNVSFAAHEKLDGIAAVVNDSIITQSELDDALKTAKKQMEASGAGLSTEALRQKTLDTLIEHKLQLQLAEQANLTVTDEQLAQGIQRIAEQNQVSEKELYEKLAGQGVSQKTYRQEIREEMLIQQLQHQQVGAHIVISPQEVKDFMRSAGWRAFNNKEYHIEDVMVALSNAPTPEELDAATREANDIVAEFNKGIPLNAILQAEAAHHVQGGDAGWLKLPQIPPIIASKVATLKAPKIVGPLRTPNGLHVIRLAEIRDVASTVDKETEKKQVQQLIYQRKMNEGLQSWITKLRSEAFINTNV